MHGMQRRLPTGPNVEPKVVQKLDETFCMPRLEEHKLKICSSYS